MLSILAGESKDPVTKRQFIEFTKNVSLDYENVAFYDAVVTFSTQYEKFYRKLFPADADSVQDQLAHIIGKKARMDSEGKLIVQSGSNLSVLRSVTTAASSAALSSTQNTSFDQASGGTILKRNRQELKDNMTEGGKEIVVLKATASELLDAVSIKIVNGAADLESYAKQCILIIINNFIRDNSPQEINVHGSVRAKIIQLFEKTADYRPAIFKTALQDIVVAISTNAFPNFKKSVVLNNIGEGESTARLALFSVSLAAICAVIPLQFTLWAHDKDYLERLYLALPLFAMFSGWIQYKQKFCYIHGVVGSRNFSKRVIDSYMVYVQTEDSCARMTARQYAIVMITKVTFFTILALGIYMAIPPYNF